MKFYIVIFILSCLSPNLFAEVIEFSEDELATESVLPIFENAQSVKNRRVVTASRIELGLYGGLTLNEAFYSPQTYGIMGSFHFDEIHGVNVMFQAFADGLSSYGEQLESGEGLDGDTFDAGQAPHPESMFMVNYQYSGYYGKISLTKQFVMNLHLYGFAGVGMINLGSENVVGGNIGLGQKFYFTPRFGLRMDLRLLLYQGPDPTTQPLNVGKPAPDASDFDKTTFTTTILNVGFVFIL